MEMILIYDDIAANKKKVEKEVNEYLFDGWKVKAVNMSSERNCLDEGSVTAVFVLEHPTKTHEVF